MYNPKRFSLILIFLLAIPIVGFVTSLVLTKNHENQFYRPAEIQTQRSREELRAAGMSLQAVCAKQGQVPALQNFCYFYNQFDVLKKYSQWAILIGFGIVVFIKLMGFIAKGNTNSSMILLPLTTLVTMILLTVSIILQTLILANTVFFVKLVAFLQSDIRVMESVFIVGLVLSMGTMALAFLALKKQNQSRALNIVGIINELRFKPEIDEGDHRRILFYPARILLEECVESFTISSRNVFNQDVKSFEL